MRPAEEDRPWAHRGRMDKECSSSGEVVSVISWANSACNRHGSERVSKGSGNSM